MVRGGGEELSGWLLGWEKGVGVPVSRNHTYTNQSSWWMNGQVVWLPNSLTSEVFLV